MIDLKELLKAGVHFGHKSSRWSPKMRPFIWGSKNKTHLINVAKTAFLLEKASSYLKNSAAEGKTFLWVGTKKPAQDIIRKSATSINMPFVVHRWIGGTLTNFDQVKKAITRYLHLKDVLKKTPSYLKKELSMIQKEIVRLEKNIGGIVDLTFPPAAIILVDAKKETSAIREANHSGIPVIAMVDTNTDPSGVTFVIPSNDDSPKSIDCVLAYIAAQIHDGQKIYEEKKKEIVKEKLEKEKQEREKRALFRSKPAPAKPAPTTAPAKEEIEEPKEKVAPKVEEAKQEVKPEIKVAAKKVEVKVEAKTEVKKEEKIKTEKKVVKTASKETKAAKTEK
jgi:small subunit ribosomal protein S2